MFKKTTVIPLIALCAAVTFTGCKEKKPAIPTPAHLQFAIDQSSREAVTKSFFKALNIDGDIETSWSLLAPAYKENLSKKAGSENQAKADFKKKYIDRVPQEGRDDLKRALSDPAKFDNLIKNVCAKQKPDDLVEIDGKWYVNNFY